MGTDSMSGSDDTCLRKLSETLSAMCVFGDRNMSRDHSEALAVILERSDKAGARCSNADGEKRLDWECCH